MKNTQKTHIPRRRWLPIGYQPYTRAPHCEHRQPPILIAHKIQTTTQMPHVIIDISRWKMWFVPFRLASTCLTHRLQYFDVSWNPIFFSPEISLTVF